MSEEDEDEVVGEEMGAVEAILKKTKEFGIQSLRARDYRRDVIGTARVTIPVKGKVYACRCHWCAGAYFFVCARVRSQNQARNAWSTSIPQRT